MRWKEIAGWPGYSVSDAGSVKGPSNRILRQSLRSGYASVTLCRPGKRKNATVHSLVLAAFVGPAPEGFEARHSNGNRADAKLSNLKWGSKLANMRDRNDHKTTAVGIRHGLSKMTPETVREARLLNSQGIGSDKLAEQFGLSRSTMFAIISRRTWRDV